MKIIARLAIGVACIGVFAAPGASQDLLTQAKGLYDSAAYSEALSALSQIGTEGDVTEVEKYRALCLLALNRPKDAEQSLEHLAMTRPLFTLDDSDTSPKLVAMYQDVRKRTLPEASKQTYQRARASFENGDLSDALRQFRDVIAMAESSPPESAALMGDLNMLAGGFVKLAETALSAKQVPLPVAPAKLPPAPPAAAPAATNTPVAPTASASARTSIAERIYNASDMGVHAPVAISRQIPAWERPTSLNFAAFQGLLEIIVAEDGSVVEASMLKLINPAYDRLLLDTAKKWRFQPATVDGRPVKYRNTLSIVVPAARR